MLKIIIAFIIGWILGLLFFTIKRNRDSPTYISPLTLFFYKHKWFRILISIIIVLVILLIIILIFKNLYPFLIKEITWN